MESFSENMDNNTFVNDEFGNIFKKELSITEMIDNNKKLKDNKSPVIMVLLIFFFKLSEMSFPLLF